MDSSDNKSEKCRLTAVNEGLNTLFQTTIIATTKCGPVFSQICEAINHVRP